MNNQKLFNLFASIKESHRIVSAEILKLDWELIAANGFKAEAIFAYRDKFKVTLVEAKKAVDEYVTGQ